MRPRPNAATTFVSQAPSPGLGRASSTWQFSAFASLSGAACLLVGCGSAAVEPAAAPSASAMIADESRGDDLAVLADGERAIDRLLPPEPAQAAALAQAAPPPPPPPPPVQTRVLPPPPAAPSAAPPRASPVRTADVPAEEAPKAKLGGLRGKDAREEKREERPSIGADSCATACSALASMARAADHLCSLAGAGDPRCSGARERVKHATERVQASCSACAAP